MAALPSTPKQGNPDYRLTSSRRPRASFRAPSTLRQARPAVVVHPLGLFFWGNAWSITAWCELRNDFRNFRLDRVSEYRCLEERFESLPGQTLDDFFRKMEHEDG
jgi:predicted DNA-binding transcriptional regulator YafY